MAYKSDKELNEEIYKEFVNEDDGLLNIGKYDHARLLDFISRQRKEDLKVIEEMLSEIAYEYDDPDFTRIYLDFDDVTKLFKSLSNNT